MVSRSLEHDLVYVSVECMVGDRDDLFDVIPIIKDLCPFQAVCFLVFVDVAEDTCSAGVQPICGSFWGMALDEACGDGLRGWEVVCCVGGVCGLVC